MKLRHFIRDGFFSVVLALAFQLDLLIPLPSYRMGEDLLTLHIPQLMAVHRGETRLCESLGPGFDLLAEGQSGVFSPFQALARSVPGPCGWVLMTVLIQGLAFLGMKTLFTRRGLPWPSAWMGALVFGGSLCFLTRVEHLHYFISLGLFPWMLLGQESLGRRGLAVASIAGGLMLLAGAWQFYLMSCVAMVVNAWLQDRCRWGRIFAILLFSGALGAVQIEATAGALGASERSGGIRSLEHSLPWWHLAGWVLPIPFGSCALGNYVGGGPYWEFALFSSLTALWVMGFGPLKHRAAFLLFLALSLGSQVPGLQLIHDLPPFSFFRVPARWGFVAVYFLACGMAHGLGRAPLRLATWRFPLWSWWPIGLLAVGAGLGAGAGGPSSFGEAVALAVRTHAGEYHPLRPWPDVMARISAASEFFWWQCLGGWAVVVLGVWLIRTRRFSWMPVLVLAELLAAAYVSRSTVSEEELMSQAIPDSVRGRLFISMDERARLRDASLKRQDGWLGDLVGRKPFAASHALGRPHRDLLHHSPLHSLRVKQAQALLARASGEEPWLERFHVSAFMKEGCWVVRPVVTGALFYEGLPVNSSIALESRLVLPLSSSLELDGASLAGPPRYLPIRTENGVLKMELPDHRGGWLRLSRSWHEGWMASGPSGRLLTAPADLIHLGVEVPPGVRDVILEFAPPFPWKGLFLSLAALALLSVLLSGGRRDPTMSS
ncbi:MAG: hypothetical protein AB7F75_10640 [Planctomycetota bacterium]